MSTTAADSCALICFDELKEHFFITQVLANDVSTGLRPATGYDAARLHGMPWPCHEYKVSRYHHQPSTEMQRQPGMREEVKPEFTMKGSTQRTESRSINQVEDLLPKSLRSCSMLWNSIAPPLRFAHVCSNRPRNTRRQHKNCRYQIAIPSPPADFMSGGMVLLCLRHAAGFDMLDPHWFSVVKAA